MRKEINLGRMFISLTFQKMLGRRNQFNIGTRIANQISPLVNCNDREKNHSDFFKI